MITRYQIEGVMFFVSLEHELPDPIPEITRGGGIALKLKDNRILYCPTGHYHGELVSALDHLQIPTDDIKASGFYTKGRFFRYGDLDDNLEVAKHELKESNPPNEWRSMIGGDPNP